MLNTENFIIKESIRSNGYVNRMTLYKVNCDNCRTDRGYMTRSRYIAKPLCIKCSTNTQNHKNKLKASHWKNKGLSPKAWSKIDPKTKDREKIRTNLRSRLNKALKGQYKSGSAVKDLGCSIDELKQYLESKFQPGMTWGNYGRNGWHIDHIKPLAMFNLSNPEEFKVACHYTNLQPLWAVDNMAKGNKLTTGII